MGPLDHQKNILVLILVKLTQNFNRGCIIMLIIVISVNGKEIFKFKAHKKNFNFPTWFCLGSISNGFSSTESRDVSLNGNVYDFSVDYNAIDKFGMLNIPKYLMTKNNIKKCSALLSKCLLYY